MVLDTSPTLQDLLSKAYKFGKGSLVLKHKEGASWQFSRIQWQVKNISTIPVRELQTTDKYKRIARLSEVFTQEVKDLALSQVSRVGTPIDPSFSVALQALVRVKVDVAKDREPIVFSEDLRAHDYVPAVMAMGRRPSESDDDSDGSDSLEKTVIFSRQFREWLLAALSMLHGEHGHEKIETILKHFSLADNFRVALNQAGTATASGGLIKFAFTQAVPSAASVKGFEIALFPYERDAVVPDANAVEQKTAKPAAPGTSH